MKNIMLIFLSSFMLLACFKEEEPRAGTSISAYSIAEMGENYDTQLFYSLFDTQFVSSNKFEIWNLGFYAQNNDYHIRLNGASFMTAIPTGSFNFEEVTTFDPNMPAYIDAPSGNLDSLAIKVSFNNNVNDTLFSDNEVYILDLGNDLSGDNFGRKKIQFLKVYQGNYYIRFANLDGSSEKYATIQKNPSLNYVAYSLLTHEAVTVEPDRNTWDIMFTRFTEILDAEGFFINYSVTGAYLNEAFVEAYIDFETRFDDFSIANVNQNKFTKKRNIIGHAWKDFNIDANQYSIFNNRIYIIKDRNNFIYKLRFLSFYNPATGLKGYPAFEFELL